MNLKTLKWITIFAPAVVAGIIEVMRHRIFVEKDPMTVGNLIMFVVLFTISYFLARFTFGIIEKTQRENIRRNQELATINSVATVVNQSLNVDVVLNRALDKLLQIAGAQAGEILLIDVRTQKMDQRAVSGHFPEQYYQKTSFNTADSFLAATISAGGAIVAEIKSVDKKVEFSKSNKARRDYIVGVPLKSKNTAIGAIIAVATEREPFTSEDTQLLFSIGNQIAVAVENARLHEKVQNLAALEERERIAREMHDGLAQVLSYVNAKTQAAQQVLANGDQCQAIVYLKELEDVARETYADVREAILGLRSTDLFQKGMISTLKEYISRFSQISNVRTELEVRDEAVPALLPSSELQVIRIIQEALNNVRKHAGASHAFVRIATSDGQLKTTIEDDGHGFDPASTRRENQPQFGLQMMRERAESINGSLDITSNPGKGTKVTLLIPLAQEAKL